MRKVVDGRFANLNPVLAANEDVATGAAMRSVLRAWVGIPVDRDRPFWFIVTGDSGLSWGQMPPIKDVTLCCRAKFACHVVATLLASLWRVATTFVDAQLRL